MSEEKLAFEPPEPQYIATTQVLEVPLSDEHLSNPWELRLYATDQVQKKIGDEVQVTSLKVKKPHFVRKTLAKIHKREPQARLYVTIKF